MDQRKYKRAVRITCCAIISLFALLISPTSWAQNSQGTILGRVQDASGAIVVGAKVTVTSSDTNVVVTQTTNASGEYQVPALNPGNYTVAVEAQGFQRAISAALVLEVQQALRQDFKLTVGAVSNTVEVSSDTQILHTDDDTIGQTIHSDLIEALPINGRDFTNLMLTNAGTSITPGGVATTGFVFHGLNTAYTEVSSNGAQASSTSYSVDGVFDADFFFSVPINVPNELAIQEFKMSNGMYGAENGSGVTQVNVDIKSGTNSIHGAGYESLEANWLQPDSPYQAAQNAATGSNTSVNPGFHQHQFGGTLGGPFIIPHVYNGKNKTFWFGSYDEGLFSAVGSPQSNWAPTPAELSGDFSAWPFPIYDPSTTAPNPAYNPNQPVSGANSPIIRQQFPGNMIPAGRIDPVSAQLVKFFNTPNISNFSEANHFLSGVSNFSANTDTTKKSGVGTARIDQYIGANDHLYFTANVGNLSQTNTSIYAGQGSQLYVRPKLFGGTWTHTFNAAMLNQATLGYSRDHFFTGQNTAYGPNLQAQAGLANSNTNPALFGLPNVTVFNYEGFGGGSPTTYVDNVFQGVDTFTLIRGRHTLSFGVDARRVQLFELDNYLGNGTLKFNGEFTALAPSLAGQALAVNGAQQSTAPYEGNAVADFLLGQTNSASNPEPVAADDYLLWGYSLSAFAQDDFHVSDRLTINAGLRWERPANLHSPENDGYAFSFANGGQFQWANCGFATSILNAGGNPNFLQCGASNTLVPTDNKDWAPRFGFSYRPPMVDKLVVRGGFGMFYGLYNRFYDGSQFDKDSIYSLTGADIPTADGSQAQSTGVVKNLWNLPASSAQLFSAPFWQFTLPNQVQANWPTNHNPYDEQWNLDTEYAITPTLLLDIGYVGDHGLRQTSQDLLGAGFLPTVAGDPCNSNVDASQASASCLADPNFVPIDKREPYPNMPPTFYANINGFQSKYDALQVQLIQRTLHGLTYHVNYTYSKTEDLTSGVNNVTGENEFIQNPQNPNSEFGLAGSDQTHRFVATYAYEVPKELFHLHGVDRLVSGWTTSGIYQVASGFPFSIAAGAQDDQTTGNSFYASRILANSTFQNTAGFHSSEGQAFDTSKYSAPELGRYGNTNKSPERTPYFTNFDASFGKRTQIWEGHTLLVRGDIFNLGSTWHNNGIGAPHGSAFLFPDATLTDATFGALGNPTYGHVSLFNPRVIQLTAQYTF
jgi:hypothetical protein